MKTHWKQLVNPDYLGAYSLPDGQDMTVIILSVSRQIVTGSAGKKEECTVAQIKGNKPMILNRTNCKTIATLHGSPYIEDWAGKQITLFKSETKLKGDDVECLRIRPKVMQPAKQPISPERFNEALKSIKNGQYSADKLKASFDLNKSQLGALEIVVEEVNKHD